MHRILLYSYSLLMNEETCDSWRRLLLVCLLSILLLPRCTGQSHVRFSRLYFASDTLFLGSLFTRYFLLLPRIHFHGGVFLRFFCFLHFCSDESLALVPMHTVGGNKLFCFSFNKHTPSKKNYTQFFDALFLFPSYTT